MTRGIIAAVSPNGVIGLEGKIPWHYPADQKRFKEVTMGATVIMGRLTWESLPKRPLPGRRNLVITSRHLPGVECFPDIDSALATCEGDVWFIGGSELYPQAMDYAEIMDLTYVPDLIEAPNAVYFPEVDPETWEAGPLLPHPADERLKHRIYRRRKPLPSSRKEIP